LLDVDVLKASHHGSRNGMDGTVNGRTWLDHVTPEAVVLSAGVHRGFKHPHAEAVDAYSGAASRALSCTKRHGTVRVDGFADGTFRLRRQVSSAKSCTYDGT
jgi:competence protein ComEC